MAQNWQPKGYPNLIPCLAAKNASGLMDFLVKVFGGEVVERILDGETVRHGEVRIGDSMVMLSEASDQWPAKPGAIHVYLPDADATYAAALAEGATSVMEVADQFYGDRSGGVKDPWGNTWWLATHVEDLTTEQIAERAKSR